MARLSVDDIQDHAWEFPKSDNPFELAHGYGPNVHILNDPLLLAMIAKIGHPQTDQSSALRALGYFYQAAMHHVVRNEVGTNDSDIETRMSAHDPDHARYTGPMPSDEHGIVLVSILRGGAPATEKAKEYLAFATGRPVRTDYIMANRTTDEGHHVTGCAVSGAKLAENPSVDSKILVVTDPMGATGGTILGARDLYTGKLGLMNANFPLPERVGTYDRMVAVHLIVAPEYLVRMEKEFPDLRIYAGRVDRGLSHPDALKAPPGTMRSLERGLNDRQYILPGAGDLGAVFSGE
ncbi:MAG: uracil phosphoribosyltransferase [Candidatus Woesearchaeota archaeon]|nr:uracil phosphoribosyltransferase [Candidatus Woesearchaeota archaeon]